MRHCPSEVYERLAVPVDVGGTEINVCPHCAKNELGVKFYETDREEISASWFTGRTVSAFMAGLSASLILFSIMVV
jgi:ribosome-binding protein aMBF1 (putative translation factor)